MTEYETILVSQRGRVGWITLNRPQALNALNAQLSREVAAAAQAFDGDDGVGAIVVTGSEKAFAAGADIKEMESLTASEMLATDHFGAWDAFAAVRTPVIAAVSGFALGGGCELAMMCDIILAADTAKFGQPEINLGVIPGMGGTQRLIRAVGPYKAAELVLSGRMMGAEEAERAGLVSRVVSASDLLTEAEKLADTIAAKGLPSLHAAKAALAAALEGGLSAGLAHEKQAFAALFDTADQKEGMSAFREKRAPDFTHR
ncbi:enoyl-CoA hydratase-related protein [Microbacterium sp. GXF6406]